MMNAVRITGIAAAVAGLPLMFSAAADAVPGKGASPAPAVFTNHTTENYVNIRPCPYTTNSCAPVGQAQISHALTDYCYTNGTNVDGLVWWDYIYDQATGVSGYVSEAKLQSKGQTTRC